MVPTLAALLSATVVACGSDQATDPGPDAGNPGGDGGETGEEATNTEPSIFVGPSIADHDLEYRYEIRVDDPDEGDEIRVGVVTRPDWLDFDPAAAVLSGVPGEGAIGQAYRVEIRATDGVATVTRPYTITVQLGISTLQFDGPWQGVVPFRLGHSGNPIETVHFRIYTDFSTPDTLAYMGQIAEEALAAIFDSLLVVDEASELQYANAERILSLYADKLQWGQNGWAFRDGALLLAPDSPRYGAQGYFPERYRGLITHELTHLVEFLLLGTQVSIAATDVWFREGIATYMAGRSPTGNWPSTTAELEQWISSHSGIPGEGNPIGIHVWNDFPQTIINNGQTGTYYAFFALAIRYLVHADGLGGSGADLRGIYDDLRGGMDFGTSFESRFGLTLAEFEAEFWDRMRSFLGS